MGRKQRVIIGFAGLFLSIIAGAICEDVGFEPGQFLSFVAGAFFFLGAYKAVFSGQPAESDRAKEQYPEMNAIERRLTDIQDIVISIDDRLKHLETSAQTNPKEPSL